MRNLFTNHYYSIQDEQFTLFFFGDVHAGVESFAEDKFRAFVKEAAAVPNAYFLGMGDYLDFASFSGNKRLNSGDLHETEEEWINSRVKKDCDEFISMIEPFKGRIIGLIGGNHQYKLKNGRTTDEYLSELMQCKYLGWLSAVNVIFESSHKDKGQTLRMFLTHGKQGGKLLGTSLNNIVDMTQVINNCDIYAMGHDHQRMAVPKSILSWHHSNSENGFMLQQKRQYFIRSGSFQKSYVKDSIGFAQGRLMKPADLGAVRLNVSTHRISTNKRDEVRLDIEAVI